ncbi:MAG: hypothetical protein AAF658_05740 [Myxococcota bacterium]
MAIVDKLKGGKSVLKRTKPGKDLPRLALYVGMAGTGRTVRAPDGTETDLSIPVLTSHYKLVTGSKAKALIEEHWSASEPEAKSKPAAKPKAEPAEAKKAAPKSASKKKTTAKKTTKKTAASKKTSGKKAPAKKKAAKKKSS